MTQTLNLTRSEETKDHDQLTEKSGSNGCPNCGSSAYSASTFCKYCGYYALLGKCIEIAEWEKDYENGEYVGPKEKPAKGLLLGLPIWMWILGVVFVGIAVIAIAARLCTPAGTTSRAACTFALAGGGFLAVVAAHIRIAWLAMARNKSLELTEILLSPMRPWIDAIADYPRSFRWVVLGVAGIWSTLLGHVFLGVPYSKIIAFKSDPVVKRSEKGKAKPKMARSGGEPMTLEEAMEEFTESAGADQLDGETVAGDALQEEEKKPPVIKELDCLIVGYLPAQDAASQMQGLVVADQTSGPWRVVGTVTDGLTPELTLEFLVAAENLQREKPFVECKLPAIWLEPVLRCKIQVELEEGKDAPTKIKLLNLFGPALDTGESSAGASRP